MSEASIVGRGHKRLTNRGAYFFKTTGVSEAGTPDDVLCYRSTFGAIEWKCWPNKPTQKQLHKLNLIRQAGGVTIVGYHPNDADRLLDAIDHALANGGIPTGGIEVPARPHGPAKKATP